MARTRSSANGPGPPSETRRRRRPGRPPTQVASRPLQEQPERLAQPSYTQPQTPRNLQTFARIMGRPDYAFSESRQSLPPSAYGPPARRTAHVNGERAQSFSLSQVSPVHSDADHEFTSQSVVGNSISISDDEENDEVNDQEHVGLNSQGMHEDGVGDTDIGDDVQPHSSRKLSEAAGALFEAERRSHSDSDPDPDDPLAQDKVHGMDMMRSLCLDDLNHAAKRLFQQLSMPVEMPIWADLVDVHRKAFANYLRLYADQDIFIPWRTIVNSLDPNVNIKAQGILAAANLTILADELFRVADGTDPTALFVRLDRDFPDPFLPWSDDLSAEDEPWSLTDQAVCVALEIRTQHFIAALVESIDDHDNDPDYVVQMVDSVFSHTLDSNDSLPFASQRERLVARIAGYRPPIPDDVAEKSAQRINEILQHDAFETVAEFISSLRREFPLTGGSGLVPALIGLASEQFGKIQSALVDVLEGSPSARGSSMPIGDAEGSRHASQPSPQDIIRPQESIENPIRISKSTVGLLMNLRNHASQQARDDRSQASRMSDTGSDAYFRGILSRIPVNRIASSRLPGSSSRNGPSQRAERPPTSSHPTQSRKRRGAEEDEEEEEEEEEEVIEANDGDESDGDFQQDRRRLDEASRRAEIDRRALPPPAKRPRIGPPSSMPSTRPAAPTSTALHPQARQRVRRRDHPAPIDDREATDDRGREGQEQALDYRAISEQNRSHNRHLEQLVSGEQRVQRRVPWSNGDVDKLLKYIHQFDCHWAKIFHHANPVSEDRNEAPPPYAPRQHFEHYRDQQAVRDKARNLKVDFLK
ncbi:hypothetical protein SODALDRAFT_321362 [Sodiomyces alkalinus F11]|uniref:Myb-like domain-containing protein n=1 Tax=Sodiomyces alkalinus (strain CBS 110278 / VKM F-3762 / F11) TaxID=1314773 RepID=A0A3N2PJJ6_SODAK|nr:hypothetical protein SODALDRAFT_321362 [Sodiomyces alkalinus F11]ROT34693.1 hypothetical protein SODALDRAFT_321362 [Sodiomyces alkalinus F11]